MKRALVVVVSLGIAGLALLSPPGVLGSAAALLLAAPVLVALARTGEEDRMARRGGLAAMVPLYAAFALLPDSTYRRLVVWPLCGGRAAAAHGEGPCRLDFGNVVGSTSLWLDVDTASAYEIAPKLLFVLLGVLAAVLIARMRGGGSGSFASRWVTAETVRTVVFAALLLVAMNVGRTRWYQTGRAYEVVDGMEVRYGFPFEVSSYDSLGGGSSSTGGLLADAALAYAVAFAAGHLRARSRRTVPARAVLS